ncbi:MAG: cupin domain-containing protein, partial [Bdellovibrionota bacterium]|nr:cupin domain-containing protein [Bdellovibrionota bacterium]
MKDTQKEIIDHLDLEPHPEGGWYKRTYQSQEEVGAPFIEREKNEKRFLSTAIFYFLTGHERSHFHRIKSDETWHFYLGSTLTLVEIIPEENQVKKT